MTEPLIQMTKRLFLSLMMTLSVHAAEWETLPSLPAPNGGCFSGAAGSKIIIVGGTNWEGGTKNWLRAIHEYDPTLKVWTKVKDLDAPIAYGKGLQNAENFAFIGGSDGKQAIKSLVIFDGVKIVSHEVPELPASIVLAAGGTTGGGYSIIVGGMDDAANVAGIQRTTHGIEALTGKVMRLADYPGRPFAVAASAVVADELFVFGGMNYDESAKAPVNSTEAYAFSPKQNAWRKLKPLDSPNRGMTAVALDEQHLYLAGGFTDSFTADALIYNVKADSYRKAKALPYAAMVGLVKFDGFIYCMGGEDKMKSRTDKFFRIPVTELLK